MHAGMLGFITLQQSAPCQMTLQDSNASNEALVTSAQHERIKAFIHSFIHANHTDVFQWIQGV
jgi:hypothetical protein